LVENAFLTSKSDNRSNHPPRTVKTTVKLTPENASTLDL
jgi:hypothetical protein